MGGKNAEGRRRFGRTLRSSGSPEGEAGGRACRVNTMPERVTGYSLLDPSRDRRPLNHLVVNLAMEMMPAADAAFGIFRHAQGGGEIVAGPQPGSNSLKPVSAWEAVAAAGADEGGGEGLGVGGPVYHQCHLSRWERAWAHGGGAVVLARKGEGRLSGGGFAAQPPDPHSALRATFSRREKVARRAE